MDSIAILLEKASIRARVAFALAIAYRTLPTLDEAPEGKSVALRIIDECWAWQNGESVSASTVYWDNMEDLAHQCAIAPNERVILGMDVVVTSIYYSLQYMFEDDVKNGVIGEGELTCEFFELGGEMIDDLCNKALKESATTLPWMQEMVCQLVKEFPLEGLNAMGRSVSKSFFGLK